MTDLAARVYAPPDLATLTAALAELRASELPLTSDAWTSGNAGAWSRIPLSEPRLHPAAPALWAAATGYSAAVLTGLRDAQLWRDDDGTLRLWPWYPEEDADERPVAEAEAARLGVALPTAHLDEPAWHLARSGPAALARLLAEHGVDADRCRLSEVPAPPWRSLPATRYPGGGRAPPPRAQVLHRLAFDEDPEAEPALLTRLCQLYGAALPVPADEDPPLRTPAPGEDGPAEAVWVIDDGAVVSYGGVWRRVSADGALSTPRPGQVAFAARRGVFCVDPEAVYDLDAERWCAGRWSEHAALLGLTEPPYPLFAERRPPVRSSACGRYLCVDGTLRRADDGLEIGAMPDRTRTPRAALLPDARTVRVVREIATARSRQGPFAFACDGDRWVWCDDGVLGVGRRAITRIGPRVNAVAFDPDGRRWWALTDDALLAGVVEGLRFRLTARLPQGDAAPAVTPTALRLPTARLVGGWSPAEGSRGALRDGLVAIAGSTLQIGRPGAPLRRIRLRAQAVVPLGDGWLALGEDALVRLTRDGRILERTPCPDGRELVSYGDGAAVQVGRDTLQLCDRDGAPRGALPCPGRLLGVAGDALLVATGDGLVGLTPDGAQVRLLDAEVYEAVGAPGGRWLARGADGVWLGRPGLPPLRLAESGALAASDALLAVGGTLLDPDGTPARYDGYGLPLIDGAEAALLVDQRVARWETTPRPARGPRGAVKALVADGPWCAAADDAGHVTVYDAEGAPRWLLPIGAEATLALVADTLWIAKNSLQRWDLRTGRRVEVLTAPWMSSVRALRPVDGGLLIAADVHAGRLGPGGLSAHGPWPGSWRPAGADVLDVALAADGTLAVALDDRPARLLRDGAEREGPTVRRVFAVPEGLLFANHDTATLLGPDADRRQLGFTDGCATERGLLRVRGADVTLGDESWRFSEPWSAVAAAADRLYSASWSGGVTLRGLDGARRRLLPSDTGGLLVSLALRGGLLLVGERQRVHLWALDGALRLLQTLDLRPTRDADPPGIPDEHGDVRAVSFGPAGQVCVRCWSTLTWDAPEALGVAPPTVTRDDAPRVEAGRIFAGSGDALELPGDVSGVTADGDALVAFGDGLLVRWLPGDLPRAWRLPASLDAHGLAAAGDYTLLLGWAHATRLGGSANLRFPPAREGVVAPDGTVALGDRDGWVTVYAPDGAVRARLLVTLDGAARVEEAR